MGIYHWDWIDFFMFGLVVFAVLLTAARIAISIYESIKGKTIEELWPEVKEKKNEKI